MQNNSRDIKAIQILGHKVNIVQIPEVVKIMQEWINQKPITCHWIINTGMHGIVQAYKNTDFKKMLDSADLFTPDGISLVWLGRLKGSYLKNRVTGTDLMQEFFKVANSKKYKIFFYGDTDDTLLKLKEKISQEFPGIQTAFFSPPFRKLTFEEDKKIVEMINNAKPDVLLVGLGLPKQETWIFQHKERLQVPVVAGIGATFKFLSGTVSRAPKWVGNLGFEWLWRLFQEPKKTWRRVFLDIPLFGWLVLKDFLGFDKSKKVS